MANISELFGVMSGLQKVVQDLPSEVSAEILARTKMRTPVQSGRLRDSWSMSVIDVRTVFSSNVDYAGFVEYGTINMSPVRMLTRSVDEADDILKGILASKGVSK